MRPAEEPDIILERELRDAYYSTVDVNALREALLGELARRAPGRHQGEAERVFCAV